MAEKNLNTQRAIDYTKKLEQKEKMHLDALNKTFQLER